MAQEIVITGDGSPTFYNAACQEHYHSTKDGAFSEALHKHVIPAWAHRIRGRQRVKVLDFGFGLGYNSLTLLWWLAQQGYAGELEIVAIEQDVALLSRLGSLAYPRELNAFAGVPAILAQGGRYLAPGREIRLETVEVREFLEQTTECFDLVMHDPFSPRVSPRLWSRECFAALARCGAPDLLLTTYSTATAVRLGLFENGFQVYENRPVALVRSSTLASRLALALPALDMVLKQQRNPAARSLKD